MMRADLMITLDGWMNGGHTHRVVFDSAETAKSEFERISELLKRRANRENDLPKFLYVKGINELTCEFDKICVIALNDYAKANEAEKGVREEFPHMHWRALG